MVKKFEEQAGADPITELSSGTPWDAMADMVWGILSLTRYWSGYVLPRLRLLCRLSMVYFILAIGPLIMQVLRNWSTNLRVEVSNSVGDRSGQPDETQANKTQKTKKNETTIERSNPFESEIPEWLQEFREILVDDEIPVHGDSHASSSQEVSLEPTTKRREDLGKHNVHTHFPKDRNCEICGPKLQGPVQKTQCGAVPRAEKIGDVVTADHKVLSEGCESRNNHRYAVVVQDLATHWIQSYPCKNKTSQETQRSLQKFLEPERKPKVIYTDNSLEFGKACEDLSWNHCTSTPHRSETNGIAERAVRRVKEGTSAILLQSGLDEKWSADSMECFTSLRNATELLSDGTTPYERRFWEAN